MAELRYNIADKRAAYKGRHEANELSKDKISTFNLRHQEVLAFYGLELQKATLFTLADGNPNQSNLGEFRNKQLRQAVILASALPAAAVMIHGFGALTKLPKDQQGGDTVNRLKRINDRVAAQVMSEVIQITTENFDMGEEVVIESSFTEGVRVKPGSRTGQQPHHPGRRAVRQGKALQCLRPFVPAGGHPADHGLGCH